MIFLSVGSKQMLSQCREWIFVSGLMPVVLCCSAVGAEKIELGMSTTLSGPNQYLGHAMYAGMMTRFDEVNQQGGIRGRMIHLRVLDDGYQPDSALPNVQKLIEEHQVVAIVGNVGTPTASKVAPEVNAREVIFYGAYTGAALLRKTPPDPYVFNYRASYQQEMHVIVNDIFQSGISPWRIAFFLQDDAFGDAGYQTAKQALQAKGFNYSDKLTATRYPRNSLSVQSATREILAASTEPEAIIIAGAYKPSAEFIRFVHRVFPDVRFYNLSFSGAPVLAKALAGVHGRIFMTQVVPPVAVTDRLTVTKSTLPSDSVAVVGKGRDIIWREGYLAAEVLLVALQKITGPVTGPQLKVALESLGQFESAGTGVLSLSAQDHQASDHVWLTCLDKNAEWKLSGADGMHCD